MAVDVTPQEALDRIAALLEQSDRTGWDIETEQVRAVLAEVTPEPGDVEGRDWIGNPDGTLVYWQREAEEARARAVGGVLDRDQARKVIDLWDGGRVDLDGTLDRLAACVRPAAIDRDQARAVVEDWTGRYVGPKQWDALFDALDACVRPVAGVTLTLRERSLLATAADMMATRLPPDAAAELTDLVTRLEATT